MDSPDRRVILHSLGFGWGGGGRIDSEQIICGSLLLLLPLPLGYALALVTWGEL